MTLTLQTLPEPIDTMLENTGTQQEIFVETYTTRGWASRVSLRDSAVRSHPSERSGELRLQAPAGRHHP